MNLLEKDYKKSMQGFHERKKQELTILLYHGVTNSKSFGIENYSIKHISDNIFLEQMRYIKKYCNPISIDEYLFFHNNNKAFPNNSVIVSFDDGFKNNYSVAAPILDELQIPAVFYISSGIVNTNMMFWVDIIEDCLNQTKKNQITIKLDQEINFSLFSNKDKLKALSIIKSYCKMQSLDEKNRIISEIQLLTNIKADVSHAINYEKITWNELKILNDNPLFIIGGHAMYHNILSHLEGQDLDREIRASIDLLEINLKSSIKHYSYPEGQTDHYNLDVINCLKKYGIECSPTAIPGLNLIDTDPFHLKRIMVGFLDLPFPYLDKTL